MSPTDPTPSSLRLAVAQTSLRTDPGDSAGFTAAGAEIRDLMRRARDERADLVLFPEASLCFPDKHRISGDPDRLAEADWTRFAWSAQRAQLDLIAAEARRLGLWTVVGALAPAAPGRPRPQTALYVLDAEGREHERYAERLLSRTKRSYLYEPGRSPLVFDVGGIRFGCASGLEVLFPELFGDYEAAGVDCVLFGTAGPGPADRAPRSLVRPASTNAQLHGVWVGYATSRDDSACAASGVIAPGGVWVAQCPERPGPAVVVAEIGRRPDGDPRAWHREMVDSYRAQSVAPS